MEKSQKRLILFMPSMEGGGVEKNLIIVANYLSACLDNICLITYDKKFIKSFNSKIKILTPKKTKDTKKSKYLKYLACLLILFKEIIKNKNVLVFSFQANIYCIILSKLLGIKIISRSNSSPTGWTNNYLKNFIFNFFFKKCDKIIVNSLEFKKEIDKKFNLNVELIYNPLNKKEILKKSKKKLKFSFFEKKNVLKIINISRFTDQKDHLTLLMAFKKVNSVINSKLLLIGYGPNKEMIINFIKKNNLRKNIKILNFKKNPYIYLKKSDLFVLSSRFEGLPNVLLEASVLKKFIISSQCKTGPKEILDNGKGGELFKVGNYKELANKIIFYHKNKDKLKKKIIHSYARLNRFDFKKNLKNYLNLINRIK